MIEDLREFMTTGDEIVGVLDFSTPEKYVVTKKGVLISVTRRGAQAITASEVSMERNGAPPGPPGP